MGWFDRIVVLRKGEATTAWLMFAYSFLAMTAYNIVKPITRSKFIYALSADNLPWVQFAAALFIGLLMQLHSRGSRHLARRAVIPATQAGLIGLLVVFWFLFQTGWDGVAVAFYIFGLLFGILLISQFWTLANDLYDARQARRIFGFIGGGASLGGVLGNSITAIAADAVGTTNLLLISIATLGVCLALVTALTRHQGASAATGVVEPERGVGADEAIRLLRHSRQLQVIAVVIGAAAVGAAVIEQQLNMATEANKVTEDAIAGFLGTVGAYTSAVSFLVQVGLTSRIHRSLGLMFALLLLPAGLGGMSVAILLSGALWAPAAANALDRSLRYSIDKTTREVLFLPLPADLKHRAKPFVDVTVDRMAKGLGALLLLVLIKPWGLGLTWIQLSFASLTVMAIWMGLAFVARREYLKAFRHSLETREMEPAAVRVQVADAATVEALVEGLSSPDETAVLYAIEMLETLDKRHLITPLLLHHESPKVRVRALSALEAAGADRARPWIPTIDRLLKDPDADVRAAAVHVLAAFRRDEASALLHGYLADAEPRVAVTAAVELADSDDPADVAAAEAALARIIEDVREVAAPGRRDAAAALSRIRNPAFRLLLVPLIHDRDVTVADEAIASARAMGPSDAIFVPALVSRLGHRILKATARETLASYGEDAVPFLAHVLVDREEHAWVRRHVPATLARIPCQRSMDALFAAVEDPDNFLRYKIVEAVESLRKSHPDLRFPAAVVEKLVVNETGRYYTYLTLRHNLVGNDEAGASSLLIRALDDKFARILDRVFRLLGTLHPWQDIAVARHTIEHGDVQARGRAVEYLDNVLHGTVRRRVIPILERAPIEEQVRHANSVLKSRPRDRADTLAQLIHEPDPVVAAAAIHFAAGRQLVDALRDDLDYVIGHRTKEPVVHEAAAWVLAGRGAREGDAALPVVELADRLRAIPLFGFVSIDEVFRVAGRARQVRHEGGAEIYRQGAVAADVLFLLDGMVHATGGDPAPAIVTAPAALNFADMLEGRPLRHAVSAINEVVGLTLDASDFLTMLSDNIAAAQGLFRMLLASPESLDLAAVHRPPAAAPAVESTEAIDPLDAALRLREAPLFARATVEQLRDLVGVTRQVPFTAGQALLSPDRPSAVYYLLAGQVRLDAEGTLPVAIGPGSSVGLVETLTGVSSRRRAVAVTAGQALRIDHDDLFAVLADHSDLLQGVFSGVLGVSAVNLRR